MMCMLSLSYNNGNCIDGDNMKCQRKIITNAVTITFDCQLGQSNEQTCQVAAWGTNLQWMLRHH